MTRIEPENLEVEALRDNKDTDKILVARIKKTGVTVQLIPGQYQLADGITRKKLARFRCWKPSKGEDL